MKADHILFAALMAACLPALAEAPAPAPSAEPAAHPHMRALMARGIAAPLMMRDEKIVRNAPYSAQVVVENTRHLADGNQIVNKSGAMSYRDSAGRTRHEVLNDKGEVQLVTLRDADGSITVLRPAEKSATRVGAPREMAKAAREAARARIDQLRKEGKLPERPAADGERGEVVVKRVERMHGELHKDIQEHVRIRMKALEGMDRGELGPVLAGAFGDRKWAKDAATRDIGTRDFGGVKAEGKVRSYDIPAGAIGNRHPITVSHERWYSPDLQVTVYMKHSDPRSGERLYRLENIRRGEPSASLFAVPPDYTVRDARTKAPAAAPQKK